MSRQLAMHLLPMHRPAARAAAGTLWFDSCGVLDWSFAGGAYLVHGCTARGGNSGSPLWAHNGSDGSRSVVAMHVAGQQEGWSGAGGGRRRAGELHLAVPFTGEALRWMHEAVAKHHC